MSNDSFPCSERLYTISRNDRKRITLTGKWGAEIDIRKGIEERGDFGNLLFDLATRPKSGRIKVEYIST